MPGMEAIDVALDRTATRLTPMIRNRAVEAGWPQEVAARLNMVRTPAGTLAVDYAGDNRTVEDLEFGTSSQPPRSVVMMLAGRDMKAASGQVMRESMDEIHARIQKVFS